MSRLKYRFNLMKKEWRSDVGTEYYPKVHQLKEIRFPSRMVHFSNGPTHLEAHWETAPFTMSSHSASSKKWLKTSTQREARFMAHLDICHFYYTPYKYN